MNKQVVFTSCNLAYIDRALVLAQTLKKYYSSTEFAIIISDYVDHEYFAHKQFRVVNFVLGSDNLGIPDFYRWSFQMNVVELCTAVKGYAFKALFELGYEKVVYLDPDIACFSSIEFLFEVLDECSILLTPHQLFPAKTPQEFIDNELCSYQHGIFNLGFLGLKPSETGLLFLEWWASRLYEHCREDIRNGIFTDQKWCDAVPAFFDDYTIIRHPGCNVASWNLCERSLTIRDNGVFVNQLYPLVFYHFTKYYTVGRVMTARYLQGTDNISIWNWYGRQIEAVRQDLPAPSKSGLFDRFSSGETILQEHREKWKNLIRSNKYMSATNPYDCTQDLFYGNE